MKTYKYYFLKENLEMKIKRISLITFGIILLYSNVTIFSKTIEKEYYEHVLQEYKNKKIDLDTFYQAAPAYGCQVRQHFTKSVGGPYEGLFRVRSAVTGQDWTKLCEPGSCDTTKIPMRKVASIKINPDYDPKKPISTTNPQGRIVGFRDANDKWVSCKGDMKKEPPIYNPPK